MTLSARGNSTSAVEVKNISAHGIWLLAHDRELFVSYHSNSRRSFAAPYLSGEINSSAALPRIG